MYPDVCDFIGTNNSVISCYFTLISKYVMLNEVINDDLLSGSLLHDCCSMGVFRLLRGLETFG